MMYLRYLLSALLISVSSHTLAEPHSPIDSSIALDRQTKAILQSIQDGDWDTAASNAKTLYQRFPNFALGKLLYSETQRIVAGLSLNHTSAQRYSLDYMGLILEAQARAIQPTSIAGIFGNETTGEEKIPASIIQAGASIDHVILVDLSDSYLMLFDTSGDTPRLVKRHYIASGLAGFSKQVEGDLKTPLGVYRINGFRSDDSLPNLYGSGALMLNYPNALDRQLGRTGSGIWLHGVPHEQSSRAPRSSEGCVTMANDYLLELRHAIDLQSTRVILTDKTEWLTPTNQLNNTERATELFEQYRRAWMDLNVADLQVLYNRSAWPLAVKHHGLDKAMKKVATFSDSAEKGSKYAASLMAVNPGDLTLFAVPGSDDGSLYTEMMFRHGENNEIQTTILWRQNSNGLWQIIHEERTEAGA